ncbi:hypothetical protein [Janthinobacterium sp. RB2R34]|uniref:hypothetical protein n=1 Tax=Janthinobacterium sp. RB2R34 TaxID=3424193 RepID=UPI003F1F3814
MRNLIFSAAMLALSLPAMADGEDTTQVYYSNGQLEYVGPINQAANQQLVTLYDSLADKPDVLSIRSPGGEVNAGMDLGRWVRAHKLNVRVMEFCISSCANYVFPAGIEKIVSNFAMIGYHGGPGEVDKVVLNDSARKVYDSLSPEQQKQFMDDIGRIGGQAGQREAQYFEQLGVRADLSSLGHNPQFEHFVKANPNAAGWTYSLEDFALLGVRNISVINPPWTPGSALRNIAFMVMPVDRK